MAESHFKYGFSGGGSIFERVGRKLDSYLYVLMVGLGTVVISLSCALFDNESFAQELEITSGFLKLTALFILSPYFFCALGVLFLLYGMCGVHADQDRLGQQITRLKEKNETVSVLEEQLNAAQEEAQLHKSKIKAVHEELVSNWLKYTSIQFGFGSKERVTIYHEGSEVFSFLARYSANPRNTKIHRNKFPADSGVVSKAWLYGEFVDAECPPASDLDKYNEHMRREYGYNEERLKNLKMKSCSYYAVAISEADHNIGVIVFESEEPGFFDQEKVNELRAYCSDKQSHMSQFVRDGKGYSRDVATDESDLVKGSVEEAFLNMLREVAA